MNPSRSFDLIVYGINTDATWLNSSTSKGEHNAASGHAGWALPCRRCLPPSTANETWISHSIVIRTNNGLSFLTLNEHNRQQSKGASPPEHQGLYQLAQRQFWACHPSQEKGKVLSLYSQFNFTMIHPWATILHQTICANTHEQLHRI